MRRFLPFLGSLFIRALHATLRVRHVHMENITNVPQYILAFWHAHLLMMLHSAYRRPISVLISQSRDGEIIAGVFDYYDVESSRGSSTRGGTAALRDLLRAARDGKNIVLTPDGPKGPPRVAKEGVVVAAQATALPIVPVAFAAKKKSCWDRGTGWFCRCRSRVRSSSMARRFTCRATVTSKSGARGWSGR